VASPGHDYPGLKGPIRQPRTFLKIYPYVCTVINMHGCSAVPMQTCEMSILEYQASICQNLLCDAHLRSRSHWTGALISSMLSDKVCGSVYKSCVVCFLAYLLASQVKWSHGRRLHIGWPSLAHPLKYINWYLCMASSNTAASVSWSAALGMRLHRSYRRLCPVLAKSWTPWKDAETSCHGCGVAAAGWRYMPSSRLATRSSSSVTRSGGSALGASASSLAEDPLEIKLEK